MVEGLLGGDVAVDYETGQIEGSGGLGWGTDAQGAPRRPRGRIGKLAEASAGWGRTALSGLVADATAAADPAVLHLDPLLLQDMVVLCLATAVFHRGGVQF